jgi:hypothetical protein
MAAYISAAKFQVLLSHRDDNRHLLSHRAAAVLLCAVLILDKTVIFTNYNLFAQRTIN